MSHVRFSASLSPSPTASPSWDIVCQCRVQSQRCSLLLAARVAVASSPGSEGHLKWQTSMEWTGAPSLAPCCPDKAPTVGVQVCVLQLPAPPGTMVPLQVCHVSSTAAIRVDGPLKVTAAAMHHRPWQCVEKPDEAMFRSTVLPEVWANLGTREMDDT